MKKAEKSWSGMRKYLETEMLAESLQGKVRYNCTTYPGMDGCHIYELFINNELFKQFSWETVNSFFIDEGYIQKVHPMSVSDYWAGFWETIEGHPMGTRTEYTDGEFAEALEIYRNSDIKNSINSANPIVKMFAILDRRVGRRTLDKMKDSMVTETEWLQRIYDFRIANY